MVDESFVDGYSKICSEKEVCIKMNISLVSRSSRTLPLKRALYPKKIIFLALGSSFVLCLDNMEVYTKLPKN